MRGGLAMRGAFWLVLVVSAGCQSPRVVSRTADEGVVALPANSDDWPLRHQSEAKKIIRAHVGDSYEVVEEKEVVTGYATTNVQDRQTELAPHSVLPFLPAERETTTTRTVATPQKEWHIHYRRVMPKPATMTTGAANVVNTAYVSGQPGASVPAADLTPMPPMVVPTGRP